MVDDCLFCKIVKGDIPCHKVWENDDFLALLTIFPNTEGFTVVLSKEHYGSYAFEQSDDVFQGLMTAAKTVGKILDNYFDDVGRTGVFLEGFGIDHLHAKLFPMHGTVGGWKPRESSITTFFKEYPGFLSSHDGERADDTQLAELAKNIRASYH